MNQRSQNFILGLAAIGFFALFMATVLFLSPTTRLSVQPIEIHFRHEDGMAPVKAGSEVLLNGALSVGRVTAVDYGPVATAGVPGGKAPTFFKVRAVIDDSVRLWGDCQITTDQPTLGGAGYVSIISIGTVGVERDATAPIRGLPPQSFQAAVATLSRRLLSEGGLVDHLNRAADPAVEGSAMHKLLAILDNVLATTRQIRDQLSPQDQDALLGKLQLVLDDVKSMTATLRGELAAGKDAALLGKIHLAADRMTAALGEVNDLLREERPRIHDTLVDVSEAARTINQDLLAIARIEADRNDPGTLLGKAHQAMDQVNRLLDAATEVAETGERIVKVNRPGIEQALGHLLTASQNFEQFTLKILVNPSTLLLPSTLIPGAATTDQQLAAFQSAKNFAEAAAQLNEATGRLAALLSAAPADHRLSPDDERELDRIREAVKAAFGRFEQAEKKLWRDLR